MGQPSVEQYGSISFGTEGRKLLSTKIICSKWRRADLELFCALQPRYLDN